MDAIWADVPAGVRGFLLVLAALVVGFSSVPLVAKALGRGERMGDYWDRTRGWWMVCTVGVLGVLGGPMVLRALLLGVALLALLELLPLVRPLPGNALRAAAIASVLLAGGLWAVSLGPAWLAPMVPGLLIPMTALLSEEPVDVSGRMGGTLLAAVLALALMPQALLLEHVTPQGGFAGWFLFFLFVTQMNDLLQYSAGKLFGRRPIAPRVSPKKTWEGFVGGWILTVGAAALIAPLLTPLGFGRAAVVGAVIAPLGLLGDLTVSAWKRSAGASVTGSLLPGFGGVLDRFDSLLYVAPLAAAALDAGVLA